MKAWPLIVLAACSSSSSGTAPHERAYKLSELHAERWFGGLPLDGGTLTVALSQDPDHVADWRKVTGTATLDCGGCVLGDDHTPLTTGAPGGFGGTLDFGHVSWDDATTRAVFADGRVTITGHWRGDVDLDLAATAVLAARSDDTLIDGCLAFHPAARLRARDEKLATVFALTGAPVGDDGRSYIKIAGTLGKLRRMPQLCDVDHGPPATP